MRHLFFILVFAGICKPALSSKDTLRRNHKRQVYFSWGYTRAAYSKSTLHLKNTSGAYNPQTGRYDDYDFLIYRATAHDRPDFDQIKDVINITIPQFVCRLGYSFNERTGIEINYDHTKYIVDDHQRVHIRGRFNDDWVDNDTILDPATFLHFEHSDGANFWLVNLVTKFKLLEKNKNLNVSWVIKRGAGIVLPRTDVTLFGQRLNNNWKVAGWIVGVESGLRVEFLKYGFFEFVGKGVYADYVNAFVLGKHHGKATHHFFAGQVTATIGFRFDYLTDQKNIGANKQAK
jgi:hypothetical protein